MPHQDDTYILPPNLKRSTLILRGRFLHQLRKKRGLYRAEAALIRARRPVSASLRSAVRWLRRRFFLALLRNNRTPPKGQAVKGSRSKISERPGCRPPVRLGSRQELCTYARGRAPVPGISGLGSATRCANVADSCPHRSSRCGAMRGAQRRPLAAAARVARGFTVPSPRYRWAAGQLLSPLPPSPPPEGRGVAYPQCHGFTRHSCGTVARCRWKSNRPVRQKSAALLAAIQGARRIPTRKSAGVLSRLSQSAGVLPPLNRQVLGEYLNSGGCLHVLFFYEEA